MVLGEHLSGRTTEALLTDKSIVAAWRDVGDSDLDPTQEDIEALGKRMSWRNERVSCVTRM